MMENVVLKIGGMACGGCANSVKQALLAVEGVASAVVSHGEASATIQYDPAKVGPEQIRLAVEAAGYKVN